jgi:hypothetical protein
MLGRNPFLTVNGRVGWGGGGGGCGVWVLWKKSEVERHGVVPTQGLLFLPDQSGGEGARGRSHEGDEFPSG